MSGFLASGDVYFNRKKGGVEQGLDYFGNTDKLEIKPNSEIKEQTSKGNTDYGDVISSVAIPGKTEISLTLTELNHDNLALNFLGEVSEVSVTGSTATSEPHIAKLGKYIKLDHRNISIVTIGAFVEGTDFSIVNASLGLVKILSGGTIVENDALAVNYTYGNSTANKITPKVEKSIKGHILLDGYNLADDSKIEMNIWEVVLTPQSGVDFLAGDFVSLELSGLLVKPVDKPSSFEILTQVT